MPSVGKGFIQPGLRWQGYWGQGAAWKYFVAEADKKALLLGGVKKTSEISIANVRL